MNALAQIFTQTDGDIREWLRALFHSEAFKTSAGQKFKSPFDFFVSALRVTGASMTQRGARGLQEHLRLLGQVPFTWQPPNGFPDVRGCWATTRGLLSRWNFAILLVSNQIHGVKVDLDVLTEDAASPEDLLELTLAALLPACRLETGKIILSLCQPMLNGDDGRLRAVGHTEFFEDGADVIAHCSLREV